MLQNLLNYSWRDDKVRSLDKFVFCVDFPGEQQCIDGRNSDVLRNEIKDECPLEGGNSN